VSDERLRDAIQELRATERATLKAAPSFESVLRRRAQRREVYRPSVTRLAVAAALVIAAVASYRAVREEGGARSERLVLPREVAALSTWRPMTDVLLETPGRQVLRSPAPLGASIINIDFTGVPR
jgi:hypothetical protein